MLYDHAKIYVEAGSGGNGCMSFRREAHVPRGGPDGGDGGRGGNVVVYCDDSLRDLQFFKRSAHFKAGRGGHGEGSLRHGKDGEQLTISVPPGTQVISPEGDRYELLKAGQSVIVASGGSGGRGNKHFTNSRRQGPRFAERGLPGSEGWIELQLKLIADVGLIGLPNAGKSSLLATMTKARPKVANYPFTTLEPNLGTVEFDDRQLIIADIPGLIEGASEGAGLGHEFLAHVERTRLLVHLVDTAPLDGSDPVENYKTVERELELHSPQLAQLPRIVALSKVDLIDQEEIPGLIEEWHQRTQATVFATSSATTYGLRDLVGALFSEIAISEPKQLLGGGVELDVPVADYMIFRPAEGIGWEAEQLEDGNYRVTGPMVERLIMRFDVENEEALAHIEARLERLGVIERLVQLGFQAGDEVEIAGTIFELDPGL